jgi:hypothetical protein
MTEQTNTGSFGALPIRLRAEDARGDIYAMGANLTSLAGCPSVVTRRFIVPNNKSLTSLVGGPSEVGGRYSVSNCGLSSLAGSPIFIGGALDISDNHSLTSLVGGPSEVGGDYIASNCMLVSLDGLPVKIGGYLNVIDNPLTTLKGINRLREMKGSVYVENCPITSHILGVFFIKGCCGIKIHDCDDKYFGKHQIS